MSQKAVEFTTDTATWWDEHKAESGDVFKRIERLEKAVSLLLSALTYVHEDVADLEGRPREALGRRIWTAGGMKLSGDLTRFG